MASHSHVQRMQRMQQQQQQQVQRRDPSRQHSQQVRHSGSSHGQQSHHSYSSQQQQPSGYGDQYYDQHPPQQQRQSQQQYPPQQVHQTRYQPNQQNPYYQQHPQPARSTPNASINSYPVSGTPSQSGSIQGQQPRPPSGTRSPGHGSASGGPVLYQHQQPQNHAPVQQRHSSHSAGYNSRAGSMGGRSYSRTSMGSRGSGHHGGSRSLGASKASLATYRSGKSSIQQEYHDRMVHSRLSAIHLGKARTPFLIAIALFTIGIIVFIAGLTVTILRSQGVIFVRSYFVDAIGPLILAFGLLLCAAGVKFIYDAYKISGSERRRFRFRARDESSVSVNTVTSRVPEPGEMMASGTSTQNAITRTPVGSRSTLTAV